MSDSPITPIEQVTAGHWWVRNVYSPEQSPEGRFFDRAYPRGPWEIVVIQGTVPFLYVGHFYLKGGDGIRYDALQRPGSIEFGRKIEEMPEEVTP